MAKTKQIKVPLTKGEKRRRLFFLFYFIFLVAVFNVKIIKNFVSGFKMLVGKINYWFVFSQDGTVVPLPSPGTPGDEVPLPEFPQPEIDIPITTWGYWQEVIDAVIRGAIIITIIIALIWISIFVLRRLEVQSKKQTTFMYLIYTRTLKKHIQSVIQTIDRFIASLLKELLDKKTLTIMVLMALAVSGVLFQILVGLTVSIVALFQTGPFNWMWLHFRAIAYYAVVFLSKFTAFNIFITLFILYNIVAFSFAYGEYKKNELLQEQFVDMMSFGVGMAGGSGKGKTLTGKTLADASQRSAKKFVKKDNEDTESAYSGLVEFSDLRRYFNDNKNEILDEIDAERYANRFIQLYKIKDDHIDRFLGKTPSVHEQIRWYFVGLWILKKETILIQAPIPMIINDTLTTNEVRNTVFDILTMRREDVYALKLDQNLIKSSLDNIESEVTKEGKRVFRLREGVKAEDVNLAAHPGLTVFWPELDKDFPFNERGAILEGKIDKLLGIFRHFTAFKQRTIGHFIYDSQQRDGVANIVRTKFDSVLKILRQDKGKRSLFLIPYIRYIDKRLNVYLKIKETMIIGAPFKKSFFRIFIEWRIRRLNRISDYLHSFDFVDIHCVLMDASGANIDDGGKPIKRLRINLANAYFTFPSVVYQDPYKEAKVRFPVVKSVKNLKSWDSMQMQLDDIQDIRSDFLGEVFLGEKKNEPKKPNKTKGQSEGDSLL